jgi:hypothetical protein
MRTLPKIQCIIICALFAQAAPNPQNPQAVATRAWLDRQTNGDAEQPAMEAAARRAALEQKRELRDRWQEFAREANACGQALDTDLPDRRACARADKAWQRLVDSEAWPRKYGKDNK